MQLRPGSGRNQGAQSIPVRFSFVAVRTEPWHLESVFLSPGAANLELNSMLRVYFPGPPCIIREIPSPPHTKLLASCPPFRLAWPAIKGVSSKLVGIPKAKRNREYPENLPMTGNRDQKSL